MTGEEYERAWRAYANEPTLEAVRRELGCGHDVANRLVFEGLPVLGRPALKKRLEDEARLSARAENQLAARTDKLTAEGAARVLDARKAAVDQAVKVAKDVLGDAAEQRAAEARLVRAIRISATAQAGVAAQLLRSSSRLANYIDQALEAVEKKKLTGLEALKEVGLKPSGALDLIKSMAAITLRSAQAAEAAVRMERLHLGEPTDVLKLQGAGPSKDKPMTMGEASQVVASAARAFERAKMRREAVDAELDEDDDMPTRKRTHA